MFGFQLIHEYHFEEWKFSLYFLAILPHGHPPLPAPGTKEAGAFLWNFDGVTIELTHNHGSELDPDFKVNNGNVEPYRGFGHLAVMTPDVALACDELEKAGCRFQKKLTEGRMRDIAFVLDPDGYWIEVIPRNIESVGRIPNKYTLAQTMFRIKDPVPSLDFYCNKLGMTLICEKHMSDFSLYFLAQLTEQEKAELPTDKQSSEASQYMKLTFKPVIELTHNHGTETNPDFK
jgi:lactoylglutathione lyase